MPFRFGGDAVHVYLTINIESGLAQTIEWYTENRAWWEPAKAATEARYKRQGQ